MALLKELSLSGVRSYGYGDADCQSIKFDSPVTLIQGPNGSGKSTILEALKYACIGGQGGQGNYLFRDPNLDRRTTDKAKVGLHFVSAKGESFLVERSVATTFEGGKLSISSSASLKQYDSLSMKEVSKGHKLSDVSDEVCRLLRVSKPILKHVILCAQEESNWPLSDQTTLKNVFDEIFESTKYSKCLRDVKKLQKENEQDLKMTVKDCDDKERCFNSLKEERKKLEIKNNERKSKEEQFKALEVRELALREDYNECNRNLLEYKKIKKNIDKLTSSLKAHEENVLELKNSIKTMSSGSKSEDQVSIEMVNEQIDLKKKELNSSEEILVNFERELSSLSNESNDLFQAVAKKKAELESAQNEALNLAVKFGFRQPSDGLDGTEVKSHLLMVEKEIQALESFIDSLECASEEEILKERSINELFKNRGELEEKRDTLVREIKQTDADVQNLSGQMGLNSELIAINDLKEEPYLKKEDNFAREIEELLRECAKEELEQEEQVQLMLTQLRTLVSDLQNTEKNGCEESGDQHSLAMKLFFMLKGNFDKALIDLKNVQSNLADKRHEKDEKEESRSANLKRLIHLCREHCKLLALQNKTKDSMHKRSLESRKSDLESQLEETKRKLLQTNPQKEKAEKDLSEMKDQRASTLKAKRQERDLKVKDKTDLKRLCDLIQSMKNQSELHENENLKWQCLEESRKKKLKLKDEHAKLCHGLPQEILNLEHERDDLERNLSLKDKELKIVDTKYSIDVCNGDLSSVKYNCIQENFDKLAQNLMDLISEKSKMSGEVRQLKKDINDREVEIETGHLKDADKKYKEALVNLTVQKLLVEDLKNVSCALDHALQEYHENQMSRINRTIKFLWSDIYKGNDIEHIEIKAEVADKPTTNTENLKNYKYHIVQSRGQRNYTMDLKNFCSAGQKVLASLIIRMALSEAFSSNCGILTLDEPTTNLDAQNVSSLCEAITDIVNSNLTRKSFQLVLITHDKHFLDVLMEGNFASNHWEISRDPNGKSQIRQSQQGLD